MTTIYYQTGIKPGSIPEAITRLEPSAPHWSWYDPRPGTLLKINKQAATLHPLLCTGFPEFPAGIEIDEARLFWPTSSLHLLNTGQQQTRYFWWSTQQRTDFQTAEIDQQKDYKILLKDEKSLARFGLNFPENFWRDSVDIIEYWQGGSLLAWTIKD